MHLLARFADFRSRSDLVTRAKTQVALQPAAFRLGNGAAARRMQGLLLSFTNMPQESAKEMRDVSRPSYKSPSYDEE